MAFCFLKSARSCEDHRGGGEGDRSSQPSNGARNSGGGAFLRVLKISARLHCQKHPIKMKGKLTETPFQAVIQQIHTYIYDGESSFYIWDKQPILSRLSLNWKSTEWKSTP